MKSPLFTLVVGPEAPVVSRTTARIRGLNIGISYESYCEVNGVQACQKVAS
jgi:hypothetical protein